MSALGDAGAMARENDRRIVQARASGSRPWSAILAGSNGSAPAAGRPADLLAARGAIDQPDRLEPGAALAGRLEAARTKLLDDIVGGQPLARAGRRAALELVAGKDLDVPQHVGGRDGRGLLGGERDWKKEGSGREQRGATA